MRLGPSVAFLLLLGSTLPVHATVIEAMTLRELVTEAEVVAQAEVVAIGARYDELDRIVTDATLRIDTPLHAAGAYASIGSGSEVIVTRLGGELDGVGLRVEGEPTFVRGESVVLFARERAGELRTVGMAQGVLPIQRVGGVDLVLPNAAGLSLVAPGHGGLLPGRPALASPRALDDVLDEIRALVVEVHGAH